MQFLALAFNPEDITRVLESMRTELTILLVALALALAVTVVVAFVKSMNKPTKKLVRGTSWIAFLLVLIIVVNMVLSGPMYNIVNQALGVGTGEISEENIVSATALCEEIGNEGIVLLMNEGGLPLEEGTKVNTFGWSSTNPVYGGTGSGAVSQAYDIVTYLEGLTNAGIEYNTELVDFYTAFRAERPSVNMMTQDWTIPEPSQDEYEAAGIYDNAVAFSDTAIFLMARSGGEGADLPTSYDGEFNAEGMSGASGMSEYPDDLDPEKHYLEPTNRELATIARLNEEFENVIIIVNAANAMEMGWTSAYENINAVIYCPGTGQSGFNALGNILTGEVNPSGKTADTFVVDLKHAPSWNNFGATYYTNVEEFIIDGSANMFSGGADVVPNYVAYTEGIYVGYKYYETAAAEGVFEYYDEVVYPFGHGLSYTTFEQTMGEIVESDGTLSVEVTVTNTGDAAGKEVVEVYYNPPYTNGGIEKSVANLVAFDKTSKLEPGASETLTLTWKVEDMASYDTYGYAAYVVEKGDYIVSINKNSHEIIESKTYTVAEDIVYSDGRSTDAEAATNQFGFAENTEQITYLSRKDGFANHDVALAATTFTEMTATQKAGYYNHNNYNPLDFNNPDDAVPTTGADNGLTMVDMRGLSYDDPKWEEFLDQLTVQNMVDLIAIGGYQSTTIDSIGKTQQIDCDGPASINNNFSGAGSIGFPAAVMIACTWNEELAYEFGDSIGSMADEMDVSGWYAPAMNTHRSAFAGRNFEYYSEDGLLGGKMAANAVAGAKSHGVYSFIKHFALNDQELNRTNLLCTWSNEQAIREIYLKPFELAVKEGGAQAVMSSFNYIGNEYAGACDELLNQVLRDEWGFQGMVLTDYFGGYGYQDADIQIRNGGDFCLAPMGGATAVLDDQSSGTSLQAARTAAKNILYVTANSRDYSDENLNPATPVWQIAAIGISVVLGALLVLLEVKKIKKYMASKSATIETVETK